MFRLTHQSLRRSQHKCFVMSFQSIQLYHVTAASCSVRTNFISDRRVCAKRNGISKFNYSHTRPLSGGRIPPQKSKAGMLASLGVGASILLGKTKYVLVALKLTKAAPLASMLLTSFAYSFIFGWPYAVGMVGLIFVHECGHAVVMHRYGVPFSPMVFVPFMGAVIAMKEEPRSCYEEAMIAFGGPVAGSLAAVGVGALGGAYDSQLLLALADFGLMINLFNLLPIGSLDGGRIGSAISPWVGVAGLGAGGLMIYANAVHNPIFYLIMLGGTYSSVVRLMGWEDRPNKDYYRIPPGDQARIFAAYVSLVAALIWAMQENNKRRKTPNQIKAAQYGTPGEYNSDFEWTGGGGQPEHGHDGVYDDYFGKDFK